MPTKCTKSQTCSHCAAKHTKANHLIAATRQEQLYCVIGEQMEKYDGHDIQQMRRKLCCDIMKSEENETFPRYFKAAALPQIDSRSKRRKFNDRRTVRTFLDELISERLIENGGKLKTSQKSLPASKRPQLLQNVIDARRESTVHQFGTDQVRAASTKYRCLRQLLRSDSNLQHGCFDCTRTYNGFPIRMAAIGLCSNCMEPIHRMKDDGIACTHSGCGRTIHFKCARMLGAFKRRNEQIMGFECHKHYGRLHRIYHDDSDVWYEYNGQQSWITKYREIDDDVQYQCSTQKPDRRSNRLRKRQRAQVRKVRISRWKFASQREVHQNRVHNVECGKPESAEAAIHIVFNDKLNLKPIGYYKQAPEVFDYTKNLEILDLDDAETLATRPFLEWRFRNNKFGVGISAWYGALQCDLLEQLKRTVLPYVDINNEFFQAHKSDKTLYDLRYHAKCLDKRDSSNKLVRKAEVQKCDALLCRIKFYIFMAYYYGRQMDHKKESQEIVASSVSDWRDVLNKHVMDQFFALIKEKWSDFNPAIYHSIQVNNYLVEQVEIDGKQYKKRMGITTHNDNPVDQGKYLGTYHFDAPIYIIGLQGEGTLCCGVHQQGTFYDATQNYRIKEGTILRMEGYSFWNSYHCVPDGSIDDKRVILILRPKHPLCNKV